MVQISCSAGTRVSKASKFARPEHQWRRIAVGRVCDVCLMAQAHSEFNNIVECPGR